MHGTSLDDRAGLRHAPPQCRANRDIFISDLHVDKLNVKARNFDLDDEDIAIVFQLRYRTASTKRANAADG